MSVQGNHEHLRYTRKRQTYQTPQSFAPTALRSPFIAKAEPRPTSARTSVGLSFNISLSIDNYQGRSPSFVQTHNAPPCLITMLFFTVCREYNIQYTIFTTRNSSCRKVMFSQASVNLFTVGVGYLWCHIPPSGVWYL